MRMKAKSRKRRRGGGNGDETERKKCFLQKKLRNSCIYKILFVFLHANLRNIFQIED